MEKEKFLKRATFTGLFVAMILICIGYLLLYVTLPNSFSIFAGDRLLIEHKLPITMEMQVNGNQVVETQNSSWMGDVVIQTNHEKGQTATALAQYKLFGILPLGTADIHVIPKIELVPCGNTVGVKMMTDGVMVVGLSDITSGGKKINPALEAGMALKDTIMSMNGNVINTIEDLTAQLKEGNGEPFYVVAKRGSIEFETTIHPVKDDDSGSYKIGLWVRDSAAGIGTITFTEPESGFFGGLGHGICDVDTNQLMPLHKGIVQKSTVLGVTKGEKGNPGELKGEFDNSTQIGALLLNTQNGIFGIGSEALANKNMEKMPIALKNEIKTGNAKILSNIKGVEVEEFEVEILKISNLNGERGRNLLIKVTDEELINRTGGIVQGMSGSPIIQNGKLVGAVTHVLVDDPTKGYGIFIETMIEQGKGVLQGNDGILLPFFAK